MNKLAFKINVLIESDWNLKVHRSNHALRATSVLIESDWNLKYIKASF